MQTIRRGAALLDRTYSSWFQEIDLVRLDLEFPDRCVLGQLGGGRANSYYRMLQALNVPEDVAEYFGFDVEETDRDDDGLYDESYAVLTRRWRQAIRRRLRKAGL
jgi:hypothetical protein